MGHVRDLAKDWTSSYMLAHGRANWTWLFYNCNRAYGVYLMYCQALEGEHSSGQNLYMRCQFRLVFENEACFLTWDYILAEILACYSYRSYNWKSPAGPTFYHSSHLSFYFSVLNVCICYIAYWHAQSSPQIYHNYCTCLKWL